MSAPMEDYFLFNLPIEVEKLKQIKDTGACVISFFGHTGSKDGIRSVINKFLDREALCDVSNIHTHSDIDSDTDTDSSVTQTENGNLRGCFDSRKKIVVLDCTSEYELTQPSLLYRLKGSSGAWSELLYKKALSLLFAFQVSHIVICVSPGLSLDTSYIRLFKAIGDAQSKLSISSELSKFGLPKSWCSAGRPACPRMLFVFNPGVSTHLKNEQIKKIEHTLEDKLYSVLRKTRTITNLTNTALFAVPSNEPFVHVLNSHVAIERRSNLYHLFDMYCTPDKINGEVSHGDDAISLRNFIMAHVKVAHKTGFDDNVRRPNQSYPNIFEIAKLCSWLKAVSHLHKVFFGRSADAKTTAVFTHLKSVLQPDIKYSEVKCGRVLNVAENEYHNNLPPHYTEQIHLAQLAKAKQSMKANGRGSALPAFLEKLEQSCTSFWKNGHQLCESVSLSGHHCVHQLHRLPEEDITDLNEKLPCSDHSTTMNFVVSCNCGKTQSDIGDPFDVKNANYLIYEQLAKECCSNLESIPFPVYIPPVNSLPTSIDVMPVSESAVDTTSSCEDKQSLSNKMSGLTIAKLKVDEEEQTNMSDHRSYYLSLSQGRHETTTKTAASATEENVDENVEDTIGDDLGEGSKSGYLSHMLTNSSSKGLLPEYPSWALTCLGPYASYDPKSGLDQSGFLMSTNYLLPWEVVIKGIVKDQTWPFIGEQTSQKQRKKMSAKKYVVDTKTKIYIGDEYSCSQGHRFFCSAPDKIIKVSNSQVKDTASKLLTMDMPLYTVCPGCSGQLGQLRHIYVATPPEETLVVSILPKIQPAPVPCPLFLPSHDGPISLPANGLWVLRLPHFYIDEHGHYPFPADQQTVNACRLLKGTFSIRNTSDPLL